MTRSPWDRKYRGQHGAEKNAMAAVLAALTIRKIALPEWTAFQREWQTKKLRNNLQKLDERTIGQLLAAIGESEQDEG
jgi:hypothetical protein